MQLLNRAEFRDVCRHNLNKRTSLDEDPVNGKVGDPASTHPWPGNVLINQKLDEAISLLNQKSKFSEVIGVTITVPISTISPVTPQTFDLFNQGLDSGLRRGQINEVRRVYWNDGGSTTTTRLLPIARDELDRVNRPFQTEPASTPRWFSIEGNRLSLYPGASTAGTLYLIVGTGILGFLTDADTIEQLPTDYHIAVQHIATGLVAATQVEDTEMVSAAQTYNSLGAVGMKAVEAWMARKNVEQQRTLALRTNGIYRPGRRR